MKKASRRKKDRERYKDQRAKDKAEANKVIDLIVYRRHLALGR